MRHETETERRERVLVYVVYRISDIRCKDTSMALYKKILYLRRLYSTVLKIFPAMLHIAPSTFISPNQAPDHTRRASPSQLEDNRSLC
jgi:hypothetical protein